MAASGGDPVEALLSALSRAEDSLTRLDARLLGLPWREGWLQRNAFTETVAWTWNTGVLVPIADLVLHDASLDVRMADPELLKAQSALRRRRRAAKLTGPQLRDWSVMRTLLGLRAEQPDHASNAALAPRPRRERPWWEDAPAEPFPPLAILQAMTPTVAIDLDQDQDVYGAWATATPALSGWPALLQAVVRLDLWQQLQPLARATDVGPLVVSADLRDTRRLRVAPLPVESGRQILAKRGRRWAAQDPALLRAVYWLDAIAQGAAGGEAEIDALSIARQRMDLRLKGRRKSSRLADLTDLLMRSPIVTAGQAAEALGLTQQAVRVLLDDLAGVVREATGRRSFRAWKL